MVGFVVAIDVVVVLIVEVGLVTLVDGLLVELLHKGLLVVEVESREKKKDNL